MASLESTNIQLTSISHFGNAISDYQPVTESERRRRPLTIVFGVFIGFIFLATGSCWPTHGVMRELLFFVGICMAAIGTLGRTWSNLFISGYKTKVLIRFGPYSMCRNPLYFFSGIGMIGIGLCSETLVIPLVMAIFFSIYYPWIIHCEEVRLSAAHLQEYQDYCQEVPAIWPRPSQYQEPDSYVMIPRVMRKNIMDAFWFVALAGLAQVVAELHEGQWLPPLFKTW